VPQFRVLREACCAQDDQLGPLEATYEVSASATLGEFVHAVASSRFLQYSATHTSIVGYAGGTQFVRVFSSYYCNGQEPDFFVSPDVPASAVVRGADIHFRFT